jgi:hypothetical protein
VVWVTTASSYKNASLEERVRNRAYQLYVEHGNESGSEVDDWYQAEEEIAAEQQSGERD